MTSQTTSDQFFHQLLQNFKKFDASVKEEIKELLKHCGSHEQTVFIATSIKKCLAKVIILPPLTNSKQELKTQNLMAERIILYNVIEYLTRKNTSKFQPIFQSDISSFIMKDLPMLIHQNDKEMIKKMIKVGLQMEIFYDEKISSVFKQYCEKQVTSKEF